jgi:hypothetical protein
VTHYSSWSKRPPNWARVFRFTDFVPPKRAVTGNAKPHSTK